MDRFPHILSGRFPSFSFSFCSFSLLTSSLLFLHRFSLPQLPSLFSPSPCNCLIHQENVFFLFFFIVVCFLFLFLFLFFLFLYFSLALPLSLSPVFFEDFWLEFSHFYPFFPLSLLFLSMPPFLSPLPLSSFFSHRIYFNFL